MSDLYFGSDLFSGGSTHSSVLPAQHPVRQVRGLRARHGAGIALEPAM